MTETETQTRIRRLLFEAPITTPLAHKILAGDESAVSEYRSKLWWGMAHTDSAAFVDRMLSRTNLDDLREARDLGIPPAHIMAMCHMHAPKMFGGGKTPTASEAKRMVTRLRRTQRILQKLLQQLVFPMLESPNDDVLTSQPPNQSNTISQSRVTGSRSVTDQVLMDKLRDFIGRPKGKSSNRLMEFLGRDNPGILDELADRMEAVIPTLQQMRPARRKQSSNLKKTRQQPINAEQMFANSWDTLAREHTQGPHDRLGKGFYYVTFGSHIEQEAFRKIREKAYRLCGH